MIPFSSQSLTIYLPDSSHQSNTVFQFLSAYASKHISICSFVFLSSASTGSSSGKTTAPTASMFSENSPSTISHKKNTFADTVRICRRVVESLIVSATTRTGTTVSPPPPASPLTAFSPHRLIIHPSSRHGIASVHLLHQKDLLLSSMMAALVSSFGV